MPAEYVDTVGSGGTYGARPLWSASWTPIAEAITAIRLLQFHATLEQLERAPSVTRVQDAPVVFDLDAFRASRVMVQSDDDEPEAA